MKIVATISLALLAGGCVYPDAREGAGPSPLAALRDQPRLALMDHVLGAYFSSDIETRPTVCAGVTEAGQLQALPEEQETALIARYDSLAPLSRCSLRAGNWIDTETEQPAIVFVLQDFTCASETACGGVAGYDAGHANAMRYRYTMDYAGGAWQFARDPQMVPAQS